MVRVNYKATGELIMKKCEMAGLSVKDLSEKLKVQITSPYAWFNGKSLPQINMFVKLAFLLECTINDLLVIEEEECDVVETVRNPKVWSAYVKGSYKGKDFIKRIDFEPSIESIMSFENEIAKLQSDGFGFLCETAIHHDAMEVITAHLLFDYGINKNEIPCKKDYMTEDDYIRALSDYVCSDDSFSDYLILEEVHVEDKGLLTRLKKRYMSKDFSRLLLNSGKNQTCVFDYVSEMDADIECCFNYIVDSEGKLVDVLDVNAKYSSNGDATFAEYLRICEVLDEKLRL